ncbi:MAG TPA: hypothetical protein VD866_09525 [Urbifossiella sp.]|nr:hypothetical protein [Urbifossiella sp.]
MTRANIEAVLTILPNLTHCGVGFPRQYPGDPPFDEARDRASLLESADACEKSCRWLGTVVRVERINHRRSTYGLKHIMQRETGEYVTNGAFIAAAIHMGFKWRVLPGEINVLLGVSERSLKGRPRPCSPL